MHTVTDPQLISSLVTESKFDPNARNPNGETPLHMMAKRNNFECGVNLITNGAAVDMSDEVITFNGWHNYPSENENLLTVIGVNKMKWFLSLKRCHFQPRVTLRVTEGHEWLEMAPSEK